MTVERSDDRVRAHVVTPSARIAAKLQRGERITAEERAHLLSYVRRRVRDDPGTIKWRSLLTSLITFHDVKD